MHKRRIILIGGVLIVGIGLTVGLLALNRPDKANTAAASASHEEHSDNHDDSAQKVSSRIIDLTQESTAAIDIKDYAYAKQNIKIKKGTTVTWTNRDTVQHNVMKEHDNDSEAHDAPTPDKVRPDVLAGPLLAQGESYSFTFTDAGSFPYHCSPHPYMKGAVTVVE
jgi:amicyanin